MEGYQSLGMAWANILDGGLAEYVRRICDHGAPDRFRQHSKLKYSRGMVRAVNELGGICGRESRRVYRASKQLPKTR
jgi:hypothetical protein